MKEDISLNINELFGKPQPFSFLKVPWFWKWGSIFTFWTILGVLYTTQLYIGIDMAGMNHSYWRVLAWQLFGCWYGWVIFTPLVHWMGNRFPVDTEFWKRNLIIHSGAVIVLAIIHSAIVAGSTILLQPFDDMTDKRPFIEAFWSRLFAQFHLELIIYGLILGVSYAFEYYKRYRERELHSAQLEARLVSSQLQVLKMQLQPHFLFNSLNGIVGLVRNQNNKAAVSMLVGLSDLLRHTLQSSGKNEVTLREEVEFLELYLDLEQMRFSDRLRIKMNIAPETLEARLPNLILQPLVENSIRHGIARRISAGLIEITSWTESGVLMIKIHDDGPGLPDDWQMEESEGIGLANTTERLRQLYGVEYGFELDNNSAGGVDAVLRLPLKLKAQQIRELTD